MKILTKKGLAEGVEYLCSRDADLAAVVEAFGAPPLWRRRQGFETLICLILEQQVSLASARATFNRLVEALGGRPEAGPFLGLDEETLQAIGLSRQKIRYGRILAQEIVGGTLKLDRLGRLGDEEVRADLTRLVGIGNWTADIYLLEALGRPDVFPVGDLALQVAAEKVKRLNARPNAAMLAEIGEAWRPWRAVATRILWHYYLNAVRKSTQTGFP